MTTPKSIEQETLDSILEDWYAKPKEDLKQAIAHALKQVIEPEEPVNVMVAMEHSVQFERLNAFLGKEK